MFLCVCANECVCENGVWLEAMEKCTCCGISRALMEFGQHCQFEKCITKVNGISFGHKHMKWPVKFFSGHFENTSKCKFPQKLGKKKKRKLKYIKT